MSLGYAKINSIQHGENIGRVYRQRNSEEVIST